MTITIPPFEVPEGASFDFNATISTDGATMHIHFMDEAGGYFTELSIDGKIRLDHAELVALACWSSGTCKALDTQNPHACPN